MTVLSSLSGLSLKITFTAPVSIFTAGPAVSIFTAPVSIFTAPVSIFTLFCNKLKINPLSIKVQTYESDTPGTDTLISISTVGTSNLMINAESHHFNYLFRVR